MIRIYWTAALFLSALIFACRSADDQANANRANLSDAAAAEFEARYLGEGMEVDVSLDSVPLVVMNAALAAVPGIVFSEAGKENEDGEIVYELEGTSNGVEYEIEVSSTGEVLEVEKGDEDEDDDEDEDED